MSPGYCKTSMVMLVCFFCVFFFCYRELNCVEMLTLPSDMILHSVSLLLNAAIISRQENRVCHSVSGICHMSFETNFILLLLFIMLVNIHWHNMPLSRTIYQVIFMGANIHDKSFFYFCSISVCALILSDSDLFPTENAYVRHTCTCTCRLLVMPCAQYVVCAHVVI